MKTLHERMLEAGLVIGHHESDLYVIDNAEAWKILEDFPTSKANAERFVSETGEGRCLDIPFMYIRELDK